MRRETCAYTDTRTRQTRETNLVALYLAFGVIFKVSVALVPPLHNLTELVCECGVEEMVHAQPRARCFRRVGGTDALLSSADSVDLSLIY